MTDPRVAPVEDNLLSFFAAITAQPEFAREPGDDVVAAYCDVVFPMFNPVTAARFVPGTAAARTREVVASYAARGLPFLWWLTPSTTSPELEAVLDEAGLSRTDTPGMHTTLDSVPASTAPPGTELVEISARLEPRPFLDTVIEGFGMPAGLVEDFARVLGRVDDGRLVNVLATLDGRPAATGTAWLDGTTAGLYNIATVPDLRGRGLGYAVTARLMELACARGFTDAILHASEQGRPVYERLGFATVCHVPQYVWVPPES